MAEKRITTVDEVMTVDENADYLLISRGVQKDLKRILLRRLPRGFDLHDDVADELATLAGIDRLLVSDEGTPGAPQKYVKLATLRSFLLDLFDLHDDVPDELTSASPEDRLLISDEDEPGDPQKWISYENLTSGFLRSKKLTDEIELNGTAAVTITHNLGSTPIGIDVRLICKTANSGWSVGDEIFLPFFDRSLDGTTFRNQIYIYDVTSTQLKAYTGNANSRISLPRKNNLNSGVELNRSQWRFGLSVWG